MASLRNCMDQRGKDSDSDVVDAGTPATDGTTTSSKPDAPHVQR